MVYMTLSKEFEFEASHTLPNYKGACANLHGHSYRLKIFIKGLPDADTGMIMDFSELKYMVNKYIIERFDHKHINEIIDNPTAENMVIYMWNELILYMPKLHKIQLWETRTSMVEYQGLAKDDLIESNTKSTGSK